MVIAQNCTDMIANGKTANDRVQSVTFKKESGMLESISERYQQVRDEVGERTGFGEPDGKNAGIAPLESAVAFVAALGATLLARQLIEATWKTTLDRDPPKNPASREVDWKEAVLWGAASGALVGIARIASRRVSTKVVRKVHARF
jgi:hypothetical protein